MDYKELIEWLRRTVERGDEEPREYCTNRCGGCEMCDQAADAIEALLAERDAMKSDLLALRTCSTCANAEENSGRGKPCAFGPVCTGQYWEWRGTQKEAMRDA